MDALALFPLRISCLLPHDVWHHDFSYVSRLCRGGAEAGRNAPLDVQAPVALGLSRHDHRSLGGAICFRILQRDADLDLARTYHDDSVQAALLVRVLSDGNDDADDL